jgi:hypothetical protein
MALLRSWNLRFVTSGIISFAPFLLVPNLFDAGVEFREVLTFVFWMGALLALSIYASIRSLSSNWSIFLSVTLGFGLIYFAWALPSLVQYPTAMRTYLVVLVGPMVFSGVITGVGIGIGTIFRRRRKRGIGG